MRTRIPGAVGTLFALDMAVKQYIEENVSETEEKSLCGTGILIRKVYNKGFAFNSMDSEPEKVKKASVMTTAAIGLLTIIEAFRKGHMLSKIALTFLSAGALSNTYDRVVRGKVVDYIGIKSSHKNTGQYNRQSGRYLYFARFCICIFEKENRLGHREQSGKITNPVIFQVSSHKVSEDTRKMTGFVVCRHAVRKKPPDKSKIEHEKSG